MYGWLWRHLPGPVPVRVAIAGLLLLSVLAGCLRWGFPAVADRLESPSRTVIGSDLRGVG